MAIPEGYLHRFRVHQATARPIDAPRDVKGSFRWFLGVVVGGVCDKTQMSHEGQALSRSAALADEVVKDVGGGGPTDRSEDNRDGVSRFLSQTRCHDRGGLEGLEVVVDLAVRPLKTAVVVAFIALSSHLAVRTIQLHQTGAHETAALIRASFVTEVSLSHALIAPANPCATKWAMTVWLLSGRSG